jgi:hypothetical protein
MYHIDGRVPMQQVNGKKDAQNLPILPLAGKMAKNLDGAILTVDWVGCVTPGYRSRFKLFWRGDPLPGDGVAEDRASGMFVNKTWATPGICHGDDSAFQAAGNDTSGLSTSTLQDGCHFPERACLVKGLLAFFCADPERGSRAGLL